MVSLRLLPEVIILLREPSFTVANGVVNTSLLDLPVVRLARSDQVVRRPARMLLERVEPVSDRVRAPVRKPVYPPGLVQLPNLVVLVSGDMVSAPTARKPGMVGGVSQYSIQCVAKSVVVLGLNVHSTHSVIGGCETVHSLERRRWSAAQKDVASPDDGNVDLLCNLTVLGCRAAQDVLRRPHEVAHNLHLAHCGQERPVLRR